MTFPKNVKIDLAVRATRVDPRGERAPISSRISVVHRVGGLTVNVDWGHIESAHGAEPPADAAPPREAFLDEVESVEEAQHWLNQKLRDWHGRP